MSFLRMSLVFLFSCIVAPVSYANGQLQSALTTSKNIQLIIKSPYIGQEHVQLVYEELTFGVFSGISKFHKLERIVLDGENSANHGGYDPIKREIHLYLSQTINLVKFHISFLHEMFHVLELQFPSEFESFVQAMGWSHEIRPDGEVVFTLMRDQKMLAVVTESDIHFRNLSPVANIESPDFPSLYSRFGPSEMFAECGVAAVLLMYERDLRFFEALDDSIQQFDGSSAHQEIVKFLQKAYF